METTQQRCEVAYQVGTYSGTVVVFCDHNDEKEQVIAKARRRLERLSGGGWGMSYVSFRITSREYVNY